MDGILATAYFSIFSTTNRLKGYTSGKFIFGRDMIILIKYSAYLKLIHQQNKAKINKYNNRKNMKIIYYV